jgi:hypothetical protein
VHAKHALVLPLSYIPSLLYWEKGNLNSSNQYMTTKLASSFFSKGGLKAAQFNLDVLDRILIL